MHYDIIIIVIIIIWDGYLAFSMVYILLYIFLVVHMKWQNDLETNIDNFVYQLHADK